MKYQCHIIIANGIVDFEDRVEEYLNDGWECQGSMSIKRDTTMDGILNFYQMMIRKI